MNPKNEPKTEPNAPQGVFSQTSMIFQDLIDLVNQKKIASKDYPHNSGQEIMSRINCIYCHHQNTCILHESAVDFSINVISVTEDRDTMNLFEPLNLFCAHICGQFARIPDPLIP